MHTEGSKQMLHYYTVYICNIITLSPENPTHSSNLMIIGGRSDNTWKHNPIIIVDLSWQSETLLIQLHSMTI